MGTAFSAIKETGVKIMTTNISLRECLWHEFQDYRCIRIMQYLGQYILGWISDDDFNNSNKYLLLLL